MIGGDDVDFDEGYFMWVHVFCINQCDNREKTEQIRMMAEIYKRALGVIAWTGKGDASTNEVFALAKQTLTIMDERCRTHDVDSGNEYRELDLEDFEMLGLPDFGKSCWDGVLEILQRSWFTRVWIIQEYG